MRFHFGGVVAVAVLLAACGGGDAPTTAAPIPSVTIDASQVAVESGSSATLTWSSTGAASCVGSEGWSGSFSASGAQSTGALTTSTTFSMICTGPGGSSSPANVTVNVVPVVTVMASPVSVAAGSASELSWTSTNATACTATGGNGAWSGGKAVSGSQSTGALTVGTVYSLSCTGAGGTSAVASVTVNVAPTASLVASPAVIAAGGSTVLTWTSTNATSCSAAGGWSGAKAVSGAQSTGALSSPTSYSLTCMGPGGTSGLSSVTVLSGTASLAPSVASITLAQSQQFTVTLPGGGVAAWMVDGIAGGNATVGSITPSGLFTAGTAPGRHRVVASSVAYPSLSASAVAAVTDLAGVYTYHNDLGRTGANTQEYALTPGNVAVGTFGKLFSCGVDGAIYGQPLWVANLSVGGAQHNVVIVATQHDSVFAFDADTNPCLMLWSASLIDVAHGGAAGETPVPGGVTNHLVGQGLGNISPEIGITGTPVIDPATNTLYAVSKSVSSAQNNFFQRLHALDITTGIEKMGSPVTISATYPGSGDGGSMVNFNAGPQNQRAALAWVNGMVYVAWASHEDAPPYYGWVMGYSYEGAGFTRSAVFNVDPDSQRGGIWMGGGAPAADDDGNLYLVSGNGNFGAAAGTSAAEYGDSLLQLTSGLGMSQFFTPSDEAMDEAADNDFGAGGAAVLGDLPGGGPLTHILVCGGKDGNLYVLNRDLLGGFGDAMALQKIPLGQQIYATGAYWNSVYYLAASVGPLSAFALNPPSPLLNVTTSTSLIYGFGGSTPSISAAAAQNGIVWTLENRMVCNGQSSGCGPTVLYAHDAADLTSELWNSSMVAADEAGNAIKFSVPTIANGRVYIGTQGNNVGGAQTSTSIPGELDVYGLKGN